jgi:hypothetical protein
MIDWHSGAFLFPLKSMPPLRFPVTVIMQRTPLANRWASERWDAIAVEIEDSSSVADAGVAPGPGDAMRWRCPGHEIELHPVEAEGYYLNLSASAPTVFVLWRMAEQDTATEDAAESIAEPRARPLIVTVSYNEAARFLDAGEQVDAVPMPASIRSAMEAFVAVHYRPEPRKKAKRNELYEDAGTRHGDGAERRGR